MTELLQTVHQQVLIENVYFLAYSRNTRKHWERPESAAETMTEPAKEHRTAQAMGGSWMFYHTRVQVV